MKIKYFIIFLFIFITFCQRNVSGEFAWRSIDQRNISYIETMTISPEEYYIGRENLFFGEHETIWWIYKIYNDNFFLKPKYIVVLYSEINTPQPVEIDLRVVEPEYQDNEYFIRQYYTPLEPGRYLIKIAKLEEKKPFDEVRFLVIPEKEIKQISGPIQ